ncbi:unnamed protein product [Sphagnum jensenii]|uniref:Uncharacterized protein n=1 Tax=Sphagnum jensenii TaxID=128206 RepID=A0ABP0XF32_9BRYO
MSAQNLETPTGTISGLQLGSPGKKSHLDVAPTERCKEYYMGEGGGFPRVRAVERVKAAACIVSELSFKLEQTDKKIRGIYCDENLLQHMAQLSESKVQGLKDMVLSSVLAQCRPPLQNILKQVENENLAHCQALDVLSDRVKGLETIVGSTNWPSLNVKHSKKIPRDETIDSNEHSVRSLNQAVQVLQRRIELLALDHNGVSVAHPELTMDSKFDSKFVGLETHIEHVASATFLNFRQGLVSYALKSKHEYEYSIQHNQL